MNVFIVEDQEWFLEQLKALVASVRNAHVVGCADAAQAAIAGISAANPDVVLVDLKLSEGTGFEVLRAVRARSPQTHLIVVTSFPTPGVKKACMIGGAHGFFDKLLELDQVRDTLENLSVALD
jgi:two-component system, NarL family, response regulator DevR